MDTKLVGLILAVSVGVIMCGTLLVPFVTDVQETIGAEVTLTNDTSVVLREVESGDVLLLTSTYDADTDSRTDVWTLNGETVTGLSTESATWDVGVMSDGYYLMIYEATNSSSAAYVDMSDSTATLNYITGANSDGTDRTYEITFGDSTITAVKTIGTTETTATFDYTWGYVICPISDGEYCAAVSGGTAIVSDADDIILCGAYTTGDNDTPYYYYDGVGYVANSSYTIDVDVSESLYEGTTDIYNATVSVDISDETFTPYRILVPYEVTGHSSTGAEYSILGVVPVIVILAIMMLMVPYISKRDD